MFTRIGTPDQAGNFPQVVTAMPFAVMSPDHLPTLLTSQQQRSAGSTGRGAGRPPPQAAQAKGSWGSAAERAGHQKSKSSDWRRSAAPERAPERAPQRGRQQGGQGGGRRQGAAAAARPPASAGTTVARQAAAAGSGAGGSASGVAQTGKGAAAARPAAAGGGGSSASGAAQIFHGGDSSSAAVRAPGAPWHPDAAGKGAISLLQEFVQCSKQFCSPQHRPILQWEFDQRMVDFTTLEFRATVAFLLDGVPHHVAGAWHLSKKFAQRDAAERALGFFITAWGEALLEAEKQEAPDHEESAEARRCQRPPDGEGDQPKECADLSEYCASTPLCEGEGPPQWTISHDGGRWCATVEVEILGVAHKFAGIPRGSEVEAKVDTAKRTLWYLRCPGYEDSFELDAHGHAMSSKDIPSPPPKWVSGGCGSDAMQIAERKTALMRVQNRLQQAFAGLLKPGQSVWEWSYENDGDDLVWPPRCRATVHVPVLGRSFTGDWARGQREAQIDAGHQVSTFLDGREG